MTTATIGICLATYEPDRELFEIQVESIRGQTSADWVCVVSDDASGPEGLGTIEAVLDGDDRFVLFGAERHLGFYRNFERALTLLPKGPELVALADQDDRWHPEKLEALVAGLGEADLVYSDARIVGRDGRLISPTYWTGRRPNEGDLGSLLVANTVTGAASLFRRDLLRWALPFPQLPGRPYHDQWLGAVALARSGIAYLDRPLYDYVQHGEAVLGHVGDGGTSREARQSGGRGARWRAAYEEETRRVVLMAQALAARCEPLPDRERRRQLNRLMALERSPAAVAWLALRAISRAHGRTETSGGERTLLAGLLWRLAHPGARPGAYVDFGPEPGSQR